MFTKTLAGGLAGVIAIGTLAVSTMSASADYWGNGGNYGNSYAYPGTPTYPNYQGGGYWGGNNWYFNHPRAYAPAQPAVQQVCKPVYKTVQVFKPYYGWVWATVYAGQQCSYQPAYPSYGYGYRYGW
jgi:hypothetical protein